MLFQCELINRTRELALEKGLPVIDVACPFVIGCLGLECEYMKPLKPTQLKVMSEQQVEKFNARIERTHQIR